jgi:hypothetical protein
VSMLQRERRQNRIPPIAGRWTVSHGRGVSQVQAESAGRLYDVLLFAQPRYQNSPDTALLERWNRGVAPIRLLYHDGEGQTQHCRNADQKR